MILVTVSHVSFRRDEHAKHCLLLASTDLPKFALEIDFEVKDITPENALIYSDDSGFGKTFELGIDGRF